MEPPRRAGDPTSDPALPGAPVPTGRDPHRWPDSWRPTESLANGPVDDTSLRAPLFAGEGEPDPAPVGAGQVGAAPVGAGPVGPVDPDAPWTGAPMEPADEDLDLLAQSNRPSRLTVTLVAGILAAAAFVGGVQVQKHWGGSSTAAAAGPGAGSAGFTRGAGGYGGFGGGGFGGTGGGAGGTAAGGTAAGGAAAADTPVVVGTVVKVSGTSVTVKNFAGKTVTVKVPAGTTVSLSSTLSLTGLKAGTPVSVVGTKAADGSVTATAVTARK